MNTRQISQTLQRLQDIPGYTPSDSLQKATQTLSALEQKKQQKKQPLEYPSGFTPWTEKWYYPMLDDRAKRSLGQLQQLQDPRDYTDRLYKQQYNIEQRLGEHGIPTEPRKSVWQMTKDAGGKLANFLFRDVLLGDVRFSSAAIAGGVESMIPGERKEDETFPEMIQRVRREDKLDADDFRGWSYISKIPRAQLEGTWEGLKALFQRSDKYRNWDYTDLAKVAGISTEPFEWAKDTDDWVRGTNWIQKLGKAVAGSPAGLSGFAGNVFLSPKTYATLGVSKGAKAVGMAPKILKKLGYSDKAAKAGKAYLTKPGMKKLTQLYDDAMGLIKKNPKFQRISERKGMETIRQMQGLHDTPVDKLVTKAMQEHGLSRAIADAKVAQKFSQFWREGMARKIAEKRFGKEIAKTLSSGMLKPNPLIDHGGIKFLGSTILKPAFFEKVGLTKVAQTITPYWTKNLGKKISSGWKQIMTAKGDAPDKLYDIYRYHLDFIPARERRNVQQRLISMFQDVPLDSRKKITEMLSKTWVLDDAPLDTFRKIPIRNQLSSDVMKKVGLSENDAKRYSRILEQIEGIDYQLMNKVKKTMSRDFNWTVFPEEEPWMALQNKIGQMGGLRADTSKYLDAAQRKLALDKTGKRAGFLADFVRPEGFNNVGKVGKRVPEIFAELKKTDSGARLLKQLDINNANDLLKKLTITSPHERTMADQMYRIATRGVWDQTTDDVFSEAFNLVMQNDEHARNLMARLTQLERTRLFAVSRMAGDPVGGITGGLKSYIGNLTPDDIQKYLKTMVGQKFEPKLLQKKISQEFSKYWGKAQRTKKRITKDFNLSKEEYSLVQKSREMLDDLFQWEQAHGVRYTPHRDYMPAYTKPWEKMTRAEKRVVRELGPNKQRFQFHKKHATPADTKAAGLPVEEDIASILYKRHNETINAISRKTFLERAKEFGRKHIPKEKFSDWGPAGDIPELAGYNFPKNAVELLTRSSEYFSKNNAKKIVGLWDDATKWWKTFATSVNPGFHFRNLYSNYWQLYLKDGAQALNPKRAQMSFEMLRGLNKGKKIKLSPAKTMTYDDMLQEALRTQTINRGWLGADIPKSIAREIDNALLNPAQRALKKSRILSVEGIVAEKGTDFGKFIENHARLTGFINSMIDSGGDAWWSAKRTKLFMFDYSDLSKIEKNLFKRLIPFYTWTRKNIPLEFTELAKQPGKFASIPKVKRLVEEHADAPESYEELKSGFFDNIYAFATPFRNAEGDMMVFNPNFAWQEIANINTDQLWSLLNPMITVPVELATNHNLYYGREIEQYRGEQVEAPSYLAALKLLPEEVLEKLGLSLVDKEDAHGNKIKNVLHMPAKPEYALRQIPFLYNLSNAVPQVATEYTPTQRAGWMSGIKFFPFREESARYHHHRDRVDELRNLEERYRRLGVLGSEEPKSETWKTLEKVKELTEMAESFRR